MNKYKPKFTDSAGGYCEDEPLKLGNWEGKERPFFRTDIIYFNGVGEMSHESFKLEKRGIKGFEFCKTARKPYDLMVCACLIVYDFHSHETLDLGSDGDLEDWTPAMKFVKRILGGEYVTAFRMRDHEFLSY